MQKHAAYIRVGYALNLLRKHSWSKTENLQVYTFSPEQNSKAFMKQTQHSR